MWVVVCGVVDVALLLVLSLMLCVLLVMPFRLPVSASLLVLVVYVCL